MERPLLKNIMKCEKKEKRRTLHLNFHTFANETYSSRNKSQSHPLLQFHLIMLSKIYVSRIYVHVAVSPHSRFLSLVTKWQCLKIEK